MIKFIKQLFCFHEYEFVKKEIEDKILDGDLQIKKLHIFKCRKCGNIYKRYI